MGHYDPVRYWQAGDKVVKVYYDDTPMNPRTDWDHIGKLWCWHGRSNYGDKDDDKPDPSDFDGWDEMIEFIEKEHKAVLVLPVYMYEHSGVVIRTSDFRDRWDSGQLGVIWFPREKLPEIGYKIATKTALEKAKRVLEWEVETYSDFCSGNVYGFKSFKRGKEDEVDSCWGFFGYDDQKNGLLDHALSSEELEVVKEVGKHEAEDFLDASDEEMN